MNSPKRIIYILALSFALSALIMSLHDTHALSYLERQRCDYVFSEYAFTQIDRKDYPECSKRFDYLTKRYMTENYFNSTI